MNGSAARLVRLSLALLGLVTLGCVLAGNAAKPAPRRVSLPTDWSHSHVVFSHSRDAARMARLQEDPRFWQQIQRQIPRRTAPMQVAFSGSNPVSAARKGRRPRVRRDWSEDLGSGGGFGSGAGAGNFPAKFSFDATTADCLNDYVVFSTGLLGSNSQATIVAFNNLYSACVPTVPSVLFAYDTSQTLPIDHTKILTSPALSLDGSQIAFVQTDGGSAQLVLLKWAANTGLSVGAPGIATQVNPVSYRGCAAPCSTKFNLGADDQTSSVFIDYTNDVAWVGDNVGRLHQFTGVFNGTPATPGGAWPAQVSASNSPLSSPVFDHATGNVFVGAGAGDGKLYRVDSSSATVTASNQLDFALGIGAGPVVDSANGTVYVAVGNDGSDACLNGIVPVDCSAVLQFATNFAGATSGNEAPVGISTDHTVGPPQAMYNGYFDSTYLNSVDGSGNYYVCGNAGGPPTLYQVPIAAGVFGTPVLVAALAPPFSIPACSPVTNISNPNGSNGTAEKAFVSVDNSGQVCTNPTGCVMSFVTTPWQPNTNYFVGQMILERSLGVPDVLFVQIVIHAGTSGATQPVWGFAPDLVTTDNTVGWLNQGRIDDVPYAQWTPNTLFAIVGQRILASNGRIELVDFSGTSGATEPTWTNLGLNNPTPDGPDTLVWKDGGPPPAIAVPVAGGTSGIIIDNTFDEGVLAGTSQIYFTTLDDQLCPTSGGTGGCAIQLSQSALQ